MVLAKSLEAALGRLCHSAQNSDTSSTNSVAQQLCHWPAMHQVSRYDFSVPELTKKHPQADLWSMFLYAVNAHLPF